MDYQAPQQVNWQGAVNNIMNIAQAADQQKLNALRIKEAQNILDKQELGKKYATQLSELDSPQTQPNQNALAGEHSDMSTPANVNKATSSEGAGQSSQNAMTPQTISAPDKETKRQSILQQWATVDPDGFMKHAQAVGSLDTMQQTQMVRKAEKLIQHIDAVS